MAYAFFNVTIHDGEQAAERLNAFLRSHEVLAVDRKWVDQGANSFWSFCVDYLGQGEAAAKSGRGTSRTQVDYREVLAPEEFDLFARLRRLRKEVAQAEAVPVYTIFTNEQLAQMVQRGAHTKAELEAVTGVGEARLEKYGERFLAVLNQRDGGGDAAKGGRPV